MSTLKKTVSKQSNELAFHEVLDGIAINDEIWQCIVIMLLETDCSTQTDYVSMLDEVCEKGYRKAVFGISRKRMLSTMRRLSKIENPDSVRSTPSLQRLRQVLRASQLEDTNAMPAGLEAGLVKWMIYEERLECLAREATGAEVLEEKKLEFLAMQLPPGAKIDQRPGTARKPNSKLRKRGEEWKDTMFIDDAPYNGPNLYVLLTGFRNPTLPRELINIGVPLKCILKLDHLKPEACEGSKTNSESSSSVTYSSSATSSNILRTHDESISSNNSWDNFDFNDLSELMIQPFCPVWYPEIETSQIYDTISYVMYDLYDILQSHIRYLKNMRLVAVHDPSPEIVPRCEYYDVMNNVPEECASVAVLLEAMLEQIDQNFHHYDEEEDEEGEEETSKEESLSDPFAELSNKLHQLNLKNELVADSAWVQPCEYECNCSLEPELILQGDRLRLEVCHAMDGAEEYWITRKGPTRDESWTPDTFTNVVPGVTWINETWNTVDLNQMNSINQLLPGVLRCCKNEGLDQFRTEHILNLLEFRRLYEEANSRNKESRLNTLMTLSPSTIFHRSMVTIRKHSLGQPETLSFSTSKNITINEVNRSSTDGSSSSECRECDCSDFCDCLSSGRINDESEQDYGYLLRVFEKCSALIGLLNVSETIGLPPSGRTCPLKLEEYEDAEMLAPSSFLQILTEECEPEFGRKIVKWFGPTQSVLVIYYYQECRPGKRTVEARSCTALRTDVCLRDFCEYVVKEEREWLVKNAGLANHKLERCRNKNPNTEEENGGFDDACFVLPGSIKATEMEIAQENTTITECSSTASKKSHGCSSILSQAALINPASVAYLTFEESMQPSPRPFAFIGYDLGDKRRVQVTRKDGFYYGEDKMTRVKYSWECCMIGPRNKIRTASVRISNDWKLRYHETVGAISTWSLTMPSGILISFARLQRIKKSSVVNEMLYEYQISWPSGLIIKPEEYPSEEHPFYIKQYYLTKGPGCKNVLNENHRKYLANGDIVKFFNDGSVIILRPNGTIITIKDFKRGDLKPNSAEAESSSTIVFPPLHEQDKFCDGDFLNAQPPFKSFMASGEESLGPTYSISSFEVLEADGRHYEVLNGQTIRTLDRSRLIIAEEYDKQEKFVRRDDGTDMLFTAEAELIVDFPDGTRTKCCCKFERDLIECDWSEEELREYKKPEGFISVILHWYAEHPNYATVVRHDSVCLVTMGDKHPTLEIDSRGLGVLQCSDKAQIKLLENTVVLTQHLCNTCCVIQSFATFHHNPTPSGHFFEFDDSKGHLMLRRVDETDDDGAKFATTSDQTFEFEDCCCDEEDDDDRDHVVARLFAISKDNIVYEYHHKRMREELEKSTGKETSLIGEKDRCILFQPLKKILSSKRDWLIDYTIPEAKPTLKFNPEEDWPITLDQSWRPPRFLVARLLMGACKPEENSLISVQKALMNYWQEIATMSGMRGDDDDDDEEESVIWYPEVDVRLNQMKDILKKKVKTIGVDTYEEGQRNFEKEQTS